jgi:hypothetical protein
MVFIIHLPSSTHTHVLKDTAILVMIMGPDSHSRTLNVDLLKTAIDLHDSHAVKTTRVLAAMPLTGNAEDPNILPIANAAINIPDDVRNDLLDRHVTIFMLVNDNPYMCPFTEAWSLRLLMNTGRLRSRHSASTVPFRTSWERGSRFPGPRPCTRSKMP